MGASGLENKINTHIFIMGVFSVVITLIFTVTAFFNSFESQVTDDLADRTDGIAAVYDYINDIGDLQEFTGHDLRITLIDSDGNVLFESSNIEEEQMENHLERPEVRQAIEHGSGTSSRYSETVNTNVYYCAKKLSDGNIIRVSKEISNMYSFFSSAIPYIILLIVIMLFVSIVLSVCLTKKLVKPINNIATKIDDISIGTETYPDIYDELLPFINEIRHQRTQIRERLKLEQYEKNKLSAILQNMSEGLLLIDDRKNIILASHKAEKIFDFNGNYMGKNIITISRNKILNDSISSAINGETNSAELKLNDRIYRVISNPVTENNVQFATACLMIDITDKYRIEQIRQEFTANVSHELKTPLTSISGYAEMIESGIVKEEDINKFAGKIHLEANRMLNLVKDIIRLSELDESDLHSDFGNVPLLAAAQEAVNPLYPSAENKNITITIDGSENEIYGDKYMINELIYNLCDNAVRYNNNGGKVELIIEERKITVKDTGIGIPKKHQSRIFERFYRVDKSRSKQTGGTGLGLAIVKHIALQHNAEIIIDSDTGKGTAISVIFPK